MPLAHAGLLQQEAGADQRLAGRGGQGAIVADKAPGQVVDGGVVPAPLPHAVQSLQDAAHHAPLRVGVVVGPRHRSRRLEQRDELRLERFDRVLVER